MLSLENIQYLDEQTNSLRTILFPLMIAVLHILSDLSDPSLSRICLTCEFLLNMQLNYGSLALYS